MTTTITIYWLDSSPDKLFAHLARAGAFDANGIPVNAHSIFLGAMGDVDRATIKRFALSERRWPFPLPIVWDDTNEGW